MQLPYLTADLPGIGGVIKQHADDFKVDEIPLYAFDGVGTHCYFRIEKRNLSTMEAARLIARALGRKTFDIGYAGLKDTRAVTTQWFSAEHEDTARVKAIDIPHCKIVEISRHRNKIKTGYLKGNRFIIRVRNQEWTRIGGVTVNDARKRAEAIWQILSKRGVPNFFGPQRFGLRHDNNMLGMALIKNDFKDFANRFLGDADESVDRGEVLRARQYFDQGKYQEAMNCWPGHLRQERMALAAFMKGKQNPKKVMYAVDLKLRQLLISAAQSGLFNEVLTRRLKQLDRVMPGDLCEKHENGAAFAVGPEVEDAMKEQPRVDSHDISPTGPLYGYKMTEATSVAGMLESEILKSQNLTLDSFRGPGGMHGGRRSLRLFPQDFAIETGEDNRGPFVQFAFTLTSGSYATVVLGEIMKADIATE